MQQYLLFIKIITFFNIFIYSLSYKCNKTYPILKNNECVSIYCNEEQFKRGECIIDNPITKKQWLTNIIIFENTNGDISLCADLNSNYENLIFETTSSNNEERIFYAIRYDEEMYIFRNENDKYFLSIKKKINRTENNKLINPEIFYINYWHNYFNNILSIGTNNSSIELLNTYYITEDFLVYKSSEFFNSTNRINKGISSFIYSYGYHLFYGTVTYSEDNPLNYYLTLYKYDISFDYPFIIIQMNNYSDLGKTKGNYISCFFYNNEYGNISCFYLSNDNYYTIIGIENDKITVINKTIIGSPSNKNNDNLYFLKGNSIYINEAVYCYYTGENDEIPTFIFKKINENFILSDLYEEIPIVYLNEKYYSFNNNIKYNDLTVISSEDIYFISTNKYNNFIIATYLQFYQSEGNKLLIRYYKIKLEEYYNIKILNSLKTINFNNYFLVLALDFCFYDSCQNSDDNIIHNSALFFFSYLNKTYENNIDFIEYAFNNNKDYVLMNFTENFKIENNIFGYVFSSIIIWDFIYEEGIEYYYGITDELYDLDLVYVLDAKQDLIKIKLTDYSFDEIYFYYEVVISPPIEIEEFNNYCDNYNDNFGDINDQTAFQGLSFI